MISNELSDQPAEIQNDAMESARPSTLPAPTYWPFFLSMGIAFIFWGLLTTWVIISAGILIFIISLTGWINVLIHE
jgi:hypothetical protein